MKLAIMQPYIFPYLGYFQLLSAVDKFVFYDDVNFIKKGWINRNRIIVNQQTQYFTIHLKNVSQNIYINKTELSLEPKWQPNLLSTLKLAYKNSPFQIPILQMIEEIFAKNHTNIGELAKDSVISVLNYLNVSKEIVSSSQEYNNSAIKGVNRIIDICKIEKATIYLNAPGGKKYYVQSDFDSKNICLQFIKPILNSYPQNAQAFIPGLSIIDILMNCEKEAVRNMLYDFEIETGNPLKEII